MMRTCRQRMSRRRCRMIGAEPWYCAEFAGLFASREARSNVGASLLAKAASASKQIQGQTSALRTTPTGYSIFNANTMITADPASTSNIGRSPNPTEAIPFAVGGIRYKKQYAKGAGCVGYEFAELTAVDNLFYWHENAGVHPAREAFVAMLREEFVA